MEGFRRNGIQTLEVNQFLRGLSLPFAIHPAKCQLKDYKQPVTFPYVLILAKENAPPGS